METFLTIFLAVLTICHGSNDDPSALIKAYEKQIEIYETYMEAIFDRGEVDQDEKIKLKAGEGWNDKSGVYELYK